MNKYKIAICDDEKIIRKILKKYINDYFVKNSEFCEIQEFSNGEELVAKYKNDFDIIFLDISMEMLNGIETAKEIRKTDETVCIFFVTALSDYATEGYKVRAYRYLIKPLDYLEFSEEIEDALHEIEKYKNKNITIKNEQGLLTIENKNIVYVTVENRKLYIKTTKNESIIAYGTLKSLENKLNGTCFFMCHQGFIINMKYIEKVTNDNLIKMHDHSCIPLSKHRRKDFMIKFKQYLGDIL